MEFESHLWCQSPQVGYPGKPEMIFKDFESICKADLDSLVHNAVGESRTLEYKEQLPGGSDEDKREFLADVSSFANASGGDLIYGVRETRDAAGRATGQPDVAVGLSVPNADAESRRLDEIIRNGIDPRVPGIRMKWIEGFPNGPAMLIRVPQSWVRPHMVIFKNLSRFFSRTPSGKYQLDVREIRELFILSESISKEVAVFRADRVAVVIGGDGPVPMEPGPKLILHLLPLSAFAEVRQVDLNQVHSIPNAHLYLMGSNGSRTPRFNFDGYLLYDRYGSSEIAYTYLQIFRVGILEGVWTGFSREKALLVGAIEREILKAVPNYFRIQKQFGVDGPWFLTVTLAGVKGMVILTDDPLHTAAMSRPIEKDVLMLPEAFFEQAPTDGPVALRPVFNTLWQASGWPQSQNYDAQGNRVVKVG
jgi:hypothetical protein